MLFVDRLLKRSILSRVRLVKRRSNHGDCSTARFYRGAVRYAIHAHRKAGHDHNACLDEFAGQTPCTANPSLRYLPRADYRNAFAL